MTEFLRNFGDVTLNVADEGHGPTIVMLHGWSYDLHLWDALAARLVEDHWRVVRIDLRGHGRSPASGPYPFTQLCRDLEAVLDTLLTDRPVLLGLSLGGFLTMRYAIDHPDAVRAIVLADTWTTPILSDTEMAHSLPGSDQGPAALAAWWNNRYGGPAAVAADPVKLAARARFTRLNADGLRHAITACAGREPVTVEELREIRAPALVIAGENDRVFSPRMHGELADAIPHSRLSIIPGAGHISVADEPEEFTGLVTTFLSELPGVPAHEEEQP
ncbi:alpha/beta hydrolase [Georgenia sp. H159]|uniref:alpha/beta fold hydrolase n=1 Tax=Georgenia sp. H159 TaxID=3076115 RepID=UPI002D765888|nr:alpha/beta hydrolase [Georgenia sp. H159]